MAAQVEMESGRLHLSPLADSSNKGPVEGPSSLIINPDPKKPLPGPKPRLTPKPFTVERNQTIRPIVAPKPQPKPRPEPTRPASSKPEAPSTSKPQPASKPKPASSRPASTAFKPSPKTGATQTSKPAAQVLKPAPSTEPSKPTPPQTGSFSARTSLGSITSRPKPGVQPSRPAAEWSGASRPKPTGALITRAKSMGFLPGAGVDSDEDKEADDILRPRVAGLRNSRPRPVSAIFLQDAPQAEPKPTAPPPAPRWTPRRPLSADLTSKFESIGLSLHRQKPTKMDTKENTPEPPAQDVLAQEEAGTKNSEPAENDGKVKASGSETNEPELEETKPEEKTGSSIKRRISLLLDSSSSSYSLPASKGAEPRSPVQPIADADGAVGVKQRIKELTEDMSTAPAPPQKPQFRSRPLPSDLTKRFASDLESPTTAESRGLQEGAEDLSKKPEDPFSFGQSKPLDDTPVLCPSSSGMQTVRASLFDNVVERHSVQMVEDSSVPANPVVKPMPRRNLSLRTKADSASKVPKDEEDCSWVTASYREPEAPSSPRRVEHIFDTLTPVEEIRAVSESVPTAHLEDRALTLRSQRSERIERPQQAAGDPAEDSSSSLNYNNQASGTRVLRVGALPKWGQSESVDPEKEKQREMVRQMEEEIQRQMEVNMAAKAEIEDQERQMEAERQRQMEEERQMEAERQRQLEVERQMEAQRQMEAERQRQMEAQRQLEAERLRQMEAERLRKLEVERQMEAKRQRQMEAERQRQVEAERQMGAERQKQEEREREREEAAAAAKRPKMVEANEHPVARPRATYFALTGQLNETVHQPAGVEEPEMFGVEEQKKPDERKKADERVKAEVPFDDFSVKVGRWGYPRGTASVRRNPSMDPALLKSSAEEWRRREGREQTQSSITQQKERATEEDLEMERQKLAEYEWQKEQERQKKLRKLENEKELERQRELEKQRELERQEKLEKERQKQIEYEKRKAAERELEQQREFERQRQKEYEREKERMLEQEQLKIREYEKQREMELERERQLEMERQRELERQKQRELERQKELERQRELKRQQELERQRELEKERQRALEKQELERQKELERQRELEKQKELERQRELERLKELERQKQKEMEKQREMDRWMQSERQKAQERDKRKEQEELERLKELERRQLLEFQMQKERERDKQTRPKKEMEQKQEPDRTPESPLRPKVLDLDAVSLGTRDLSPTSRWRQPSPRAEEAYKPSILDIDSIRDQMQPEVSVDSFGMTEFAMTKPVTPANPLLQNLQPNTAPPYQQHSIPPPQYQLPPYQAQPSVPSEQVCLQPQVLHPAFNPERSKTQPDWASPQPEPWGMSQREVAVDEPLWVSSKEGSRRPISTRLSIEQMLQRQEERVSGSVQSPTLLNPTQTPAFPAFSNQGPTVMPTSGMGSSPFSILTPERVWTAPTDRAPASEPRREAQPSAPVTEPFWTPNWELASQELNQNQQRNKETQDQVRMRSRSVSRRSTPAESSVDGQLSRLRSRSAHRDRARPTWEQAKQSGQEEPKDTDTLVQETDSQYGTWETGLRTDDSLTPATPPSDSNLTPSPRKPTPTLTPDEATPTDTPTSPTSAASEEPEEPLPFPETPTALLDSSVLRSRAQLGKRMSRRAPPSRNARHSAMLSQLTEGSAGEEWRYKDSTEDKTDSKPQQDEESDSEEPTREARTPASSSSTTQPQRVSLFPGMDPSAIMAQLKKRGDGDTQSDSPAPSSSSSQPSRSPKSPFLPRAARVLPPAGGKENGEASSPQWLKELKTKKRLSQYENDS